MAKKYVMALDAGTTSNRAIIFDENSKIVGVSQKEFTQYFPNPGWVEHVIGVQNRDLDGTGGFLGQYRHTGQAEQQAEHHRA